MKRKRGPLSDEERLWLKLNYPHMSSEICAIRLGMAVSTVRWHAWSMGLTKTEEYRQACNEYRRRRVSEALRERHRRERESKMNNN